MVGQKLAPGVIISGKYRLLERLGGGGMGDVYRAEHQLAGRLVAFKLLRSDFAEDDDLTRRFFQEAQAVNRIRHPNIVDVLDAGFSEKGPYVVMECLEGASLATALARVGKLDVPTAVSVVLPVLDALDSAHRHGIVHRDLKPENIYLARYGSEVRPKILDFGIAKVMDPDGGAARPHTHTGIIFGTPDYLSPEQASGDGVVDGRSDVFALGIVLFELVTGRRPFEAKSAVATAYKIVHEAAPRIAACGFRGDPLVQSVLDIALSKRPDERFGSAASFADMLAPLVPDGATRKSSLRALLDMALAMVPTEAAPDLARQQQPISTSPEPPVSRDATPVPPAPAPSTPPVEPKRVPPVAPTLASSGVDLSSRPIELEPVPPPSADPVAPRTSYVRDRPSPGPIPVRTMPPEAKSSPKLQFTPAPGTSRPVASPPSLSLRSLNPEESTQAKRQSPLRQPVWTPRPLPAHVKGRCHIRGTLPRAISRWVERQFGEKRRAEVLALLPAVHADAFRADAFNALVWYELEPADMFMEATTVTLMAGEITQWRELARESFDRDLAAILRPSARLTDAESLVKRSVSGWGRLFDFGNMRLSEAVLGRMTVRIDGFEATSLAMRYAVVGTMEGMLRTAGVPDVTARIVAGESSFARDFEYELGWRS